MRSNLFGVQEKTLFSKSLIWQFNQDFYHEKGIAAWSEGIVPHEITNSSLASTTYAELIYALLKDIEAQGKTDQIVYILELGAGHGKLCFNILRHLDKLVAEDSTCKMSYCYVLSDIVEDNLSFYSDHPKLQAYFERGILDLSYFDATKSRSLELQKSGKTIRSSDLALPILTVANYFFDSIPNELFFFRDEAMFDCSISIDTLSDPQGKTAQDLISQMELTYHQSEVTSASFSSEIQQEILEGYRQLEGESYILFPSMGIDCLANIASLSKGGLIVLTMDKGYKEFQDLSGRVMPDIVKHGSFSLWVNFHAMSQYCLKKGGHIMFDSSTNLSIELAGLFFSKTRLDYPLFEQMYRKHARQLNLDDLNSMKKLVYKNMDTVNLSELLGLIRLCSYDSSIFINLLPSIKQLAKSISIKQRARLEQTIHKVWANYYAINVAYDLSYELGGLLYDLAYYESALDYFKHSVTTFGEKIDVSYNQILCYFQLRQDDLFYETLAAAKLRFPGTQVFSSLEGLDMA